MIKNLSLLLLYTITLAVHGQTTNIPDANFEQGLIDLGLDTGTPDGVVATASIDTVTVLEIASLSITDLTGIADFTSLTYLNCIYNDLTTLDLSQNTALKKLYCYMNYGIANLDVSNCTLLETLDFAYNNVTAINLTVLPNLIELDCGFNQITSLDVSQNSSLKYLKCYYNQLTSIDVSDNSALETLNILSNSITTLNISANASLDYLDCSSNPLTSIDIGHNPLLETLYCNDNQLTQLNVYPLTKLKWLECMNNSITELNLSQTTELIRIRCNDNNLTCLNMQNGHNTNMGGGVYEPFTSTNNPNLTCVMVDDVTFSDTYWLDIDGTTTFSTNCGSNCTVTLGIEAITNNIPKQLISITDLLGRSTTYQPNVVLIYFYSDGSFEKKLDIR